MGEIKVGAANAIALRKSADSGALNVQLDAASDVPIMEQLAEALAANLDRVIDVFRAWDTDGSGMISKREFRQGLSMLGLKELPREQVDALFDQIDTDHNGAIEYGEINHKLRRRIDPEEILRRRAAFLKKERLNAQGDASTTRSNRTRKAARAEAYLALKAQEALVMHRLVSVQRELLRSQSEAAIAESRLRKVQAVQEMKADMDERHGKDITTKFAEIAAATPEEVHPATHPPCLTLPRPRALLSPPASTTLAQPTILPKSQHSAPARAQAQGAHATLAAALPAAQHAGRGGDDVAPLCLGLLFRFLRRCRGAVNPPHRNADGHRSRVPGRGGARGQALRGGRRE